MSESERPALTPNGWEVDLGTRELRARGVRVPIGSRAFEIVEALVNAAGELVTKDEIMRRVWPGAIVEDNTIQVHISAIRKALGADRRMLKTVSGRGYRLLGNWRIRQDQTPAKRDGPEHSGATPKPFLTNIPAAASALIGRETALQHLEDLLSAYREVTLTGPGGIGKTVLASEVARRLFPRIESDVVFVELVSLSDPALVPSAVASALGLRLGSDEISSASVARAICSKKLLLVLDNCEHVVGAAATMVETLLHACPCTTILSTSRELLRIEGEHVFGVPPLAVPERNQTDPDHILSHSAVGLFIARTRSLGFNTFPHSDDLLAIAGICRRLDGIPLAIELAAARASTLGIRELAARLDDFLGLLGGGRRTALPRHQTLRATLDWSYELLPQDEQRLLGHLAVFPAGFTLAAVVAVARGTGTAESSSEDGISNLVSKSFVALDGATPDGRWRLLETTRAYALEKLTDTDEVGEARRRHAAFFRDLIGSMASTSVLASRGPGLDDCLREIDNTRAALDWAFSTEGDAEIGIGLTAAHGPVWLDASMMVECRDRTEHALQCLKPTANSLLHMQLRLALGIALFVTSGSIERSKQLLLEALQAAESLGNVAAQLRALWSLWTLCVHTGECTLGQDLAERFFAVGLRSDNNVTLPVAHRILGSSLHFVGNQIEARRHLERVIELSDQSIHGYSSWFLYDQNVLAQALLARAMWLQGFLEQALSMAQTSLTEALAADNKLTLCIVSLGVIPIALMTGEHATAERALTMLTETATRNNFQLYTTLGRCHEGELLVSRREFAAGTALLRAALENDGRGHGTNQSYPPQLGVLAYGLTELGQLEEARSTIDRALDGAEAGGQSWYHAELLRTKGELLARQGAESFSLAEAQFRAALDIAGQQGALFWELRAAASLARLFHGRSRADEGRAILASVYDRFTEGFQTADMIDARALLQSS